VSGHRPPPLLCLRDWPGLSCPDQACAEKLAMTSEASSGSRRPRSGMLRRQSPEEDSTVLIDVAPEAEKGHTYGSTAPTSEQCLLGSVAPPRNFVRVWEKALRPGRQQGGAGRDETDTRGAWRETFLDNLRAAGLHVDQRAVQGQNGAVQYVLLRAPWAVLCYYAEDLRLKLPLQELPNQASNWSAGLLAWLGLPNILLEDVPDVPPEYYSCPFKVSKLSRFLGSDNRENFFTSTERHQILFAILAKTPYGHERKGLCGIDQLLAEGVFSAAFPLHDGPFRTPPEGPQAPGLTQRQVLYRYWARWSQWNKYQPLDHVRRYFGEKVAFYFAWLGFYTGWLLPAAAVGTLVFLAGCFLVSSDIPTQELCSSTDHFEMCPLCLDCPFWLLSSACTPVQVRGTAHRLGPWAFPRGRRPCGLACTPPTLDRAPWCPGWTRRPDTLLIYSWDPVGISFLGPLAQVIIRAGTTASSRGPCSARPLHGGSRTCLAPQVAVVVMRLVCIILYRAIMPILVSRSNNTLLAAWASRTGSVVNLVFILVLSKIYVALARILTRWEMHRTQTKFEDAFTLKVFIFQFVNFYSSPIYIAFFKGRFVGYPGNYHTLFGVRNEECAAGGCLIELAQELLVIMVGKQIINNVQEILVPKLQGSWQKFRLRSKKRKAGASEAVGQAPWEADYELLPCEGLFKEYLEMVLQFGFVTIFVAACPLAPLFALLNNWVEVRLDARKFVCEHRRPVAERAYQFLLVLLSHLALSPAPHTEFRVSCRYQAFREDDGQYSPTYWNLLAIRLAFVIVFEVSQLPSSPGHPPLPQDALPNPRMW
uniref:Anoctamin n=1 Tax=Panthera tigris altaica TaxID=74533 RepID=A0A8C9K9B2_PANTA